MNTSSPANTPASENTEDLRRQLTEARSIIGQVTLTLIAAITWGAGALDDTQHITSHEAIAEELLDRLGKALSQVTGADVTVTDDGRVALGTGEISTQGPRGGTGTVPGDTL